MVVIVLLYAFFASIFILGKFALLYVSPILFIGIRMTLGGVLLLAYCFFIMPKKNRISIAKKDYWNFLQIILFHIFLSYNLEYIALNHVSSTKACLAYNFSPFFTAILAYFLFTERLTLLQWLGLYIGFLGFIPMLMMQSSSTLLWTLSSYDLLLLISVASSAYGWMMVKNLGNKNYSFVLINGVGMLGGGILSLIISFFYEGPPIIKNAPVVSTFLAQNVGIYGENIIMFILCIILVILIANIICYNLYAYLLSKHSPTLLSFAGFLTPFFTALFEFILFKEPITVPFIITMCIVFSGLYLFSYKKQIFLKSK